MEQQIRAVLFDMDGLMFDTERLGDEVWRAVAGKYGVTMTPEDVSLLRGRNYESGRRAFLERFGAGFPYDDMSAEVWREVEARLEHSVPLRPGLFELLDALRHIEKNPESIRSMLINGSFLRHPDAARDVARATLELTAHPKSADDPQRRKHFLRFYWGGKPAHTR